MNQAEHILSLIGKDAFQKLVNHYHGQHLYMPHQVPDPTRNNVIITLFSESLNDGATCMSAYQRCAEESGMSLRQVQRIVAAS